MKNILKNTMFLGLLIFLIMVSQIIPCTIFCVSDQNRNIVLTGNNEDGFNSKTLLWFQPAESKKYGVIFWSYNDGFPQGGMNNQGLFFDGTANKFLPVKSSLHKPRINPLVLIKTMMETCASVKEVLLYIDKYNLKDLKKSQLFIADKTGDAAIIEGDVIIRKKENFLIATNFYHSLVKDKKYTCERYKTAKKMIENNKKFSIDFACSVLNAVKQDFTQYSTVCNLQKKEIFLYHKRDFEKVVKIDLIKELKKGSQTIKIASLFEKQ